MAIEGLAMRFGAHHYPPSFHIVIVSSLVACFALPVARKLDNWIGLIALVIGSIAYITFFGVVFVLTWRAISEWRSERRRPKS